MSKFMLESFAVYKSKIDGHFKVATVAMEALGHLGV